MKKLCKALALTLCTIMLLSTLTVAADSTDDNLLTLEEAKQIALDNDVQYKLQQNYIRQKSNDYEDIYDVYSAAPKGTYKSIVARADMEVKYKMNIETAAAAIRKEIFTRNDLKRKSNYEVTVAYYDVMEAHYTLEGKRRAMELSGKDAEVAKLRHQLGIITSTQLSQAENAYSSSKADYNKAFSELQNYMAALSKIIGRNLDVFNDKIDMTLTLPDLASLDMNKIKEDYMKKSSDFYALSEAFDMAEYKLQLTEDKYDYYGKRIPNKASNLAGELDDLLDNAQRDYDSAKYQYSEAEKGLNVTLNNLYTGINTIQESIKTLQKNLEDTRTTVEQNKLQYELGLIAKITLEKSEAALKDLENTVNTTIIGLNTQYLALTQYSYEPEK